MASSSSGVLAPDNEKFFNLFARSSPSPPPADFLPAFSAPPIVHSATTPLIQIAPPSRAPSQATSRQQSPSPSQLTSSQSQSTSPQQSPSPSPSPPPPPPHSLPAFLYSNRPKYYPSDTSSETDSRSDIESDNYQSRPSSPLRSLRWALAPDVDVDVDVDTEAAIAGVLGSDVDEEDFDTTIANLRDNSTRRLADAWQSVFDRFGREDVDYDDHDYGYGDDYDSDSSVSQEFGQESMDRGISMDKSGRKSTSIDRSRERSTSRDRGRRRTSTDWGHVRVKVEPEESADGEVDDYAGADLMDDESQSSSRSPTHLNDQDRHHHHRRPSKEQDIPERAQIVPKDHNHHHHHHHHHHRPHSLPTHAQSILEFWKRDLQRKEEIRIPGTGSERLQGSHTHTQTHSDILHHLEDAVQPTPVKFPSLVAEYNDNGMETGDYNSPGSNYDEPELHHQHRRDYRISLNEQDHISRSQSTQRLEVYKNDVARKARVFELWRLFVAARRVPPARRRIDPLEEEEIFEELVESEEEDREESAAEEEDEEEEVYDADESDIEAEQASPSHHRQRQQQHQQQEREPSPKPIPAPQPPMTGLREMTPELAQLYNRSGTLRLNMMPQARALADALSPKKPAPSTLLRHLNTPSGLNPNPLAGGSNPFGGGGGANRRPSEADYSKTQLSPPPFLPSPSSSRTLWPTTTFQDNMTTPPRKTPSYIMTTPTTKSTAATSIQDLYSTITLPPFDYDSDSGSSSRRTPPELNSTSNNVDTFYRTTTEAELLTLTIPQPLMLNDADEELLRATAALSTSTPQKPKTRVMMDPVEARLMTPKSRALASLLMSKKKTPHPMSVSSPAAAAFPSSTSEFGSVSGSGPTPSASSSTTTPTPSMSPTPSTPPPSSSSAPYLKSSTIAGQRGTKRQYGQDNDVEMMDDLDAFFMDQTAAPPSSKLVKTEASSDQIFRHHRPHSPHRHHRPYSLS